VLISDLVNQGISIARRAHASLYIIGLFINEDLKLKKEKEKKSSAGQSRVLLYSPLVT